MGNQLSLSFHDTTHLDRKGLQIATKKAVTQEFHVLEIFRKKHKLTASEVWQIFGQTKAPLTSIRRAISNLAFEEKLLKCDDKREGIYGSPEHYYQINF